MRWGIVGPGKIAAKFAEALATMPGERLHAVSGRRAETATAFGQRWGALVHDSVAALLADPAVEAVYIATPHSEHAAVARACIEAGRPVLCEKPLAANAAQARELIALARERGVFLMEALWTRYLPALRQAEAWLQQGRIGRLLAIQSSFGFRCDYDPQHRNFNPALAGGTLLDIGIYNLSLAQWAMALQGVHETPTLQATGVLAPTGTEMRCSVQMHYTDGTLSQFTCAFDVALENVLRLHGERGCIELGPHFWGAQRATLQLEGQPPEVLELPPACNGFEYQIQAAVQAMAAGRREEARIPHAQTLALLEQIDALRRQLGAVRFPFE